MAQINSELQKQINELFIQAYDNFRAVGIALGNAELARQDMEIELNTKAKAAAAVIAADAIERARK
jgi:hypothetical protein